MVTLIQSRSLELY